MLSEKFDYKPFLKQSYIDPIRTITVIDDQYPTLKGLIDKGREHYDKDDLDRLDDIIKVSRSEEFNWLLDVHDGEESEFDENNVANRLHHSDLLILDYHLDGEDNGFCAKSINIIKNLTENMHFNIVVVHTKGYTGAKGTVNDVLNDIVVSLQEKPRYLNINNKLDTEIQDKLLLWNHDDDGITGQLKEAIATVDLLDLINKYQGGILNPSFEHDCLDVLNDIYENRPEGIILNKQDLFRWVFCKKLAIYSDKFAVRAAKHFGWGKSGDVNWVKTEDLFLTVVGKKESVNSIPARILNAMEKWKPHPHKLILSKLRHEIDEKGMSASSNILDKKYLQAVWLNELLNSKTDYEANTSVWSTIIKLWEELASEIRPSISQFTKELVLKLKEAEIDKDTLLQHFIESDTLSNKTEQVKHANCFSCSRTISTHHLVTGHILKIKDLYWLCLTPICDLVPDQKIKKKTNEDENEINNHEDKKKLLPVTLVQMYDAREAFQSTRIQMIEKLGLPEGTVPNLNNNQIIEQIIEHSTENNMLFIRPTDDADDIKILSFTVGLDGKAVPKSVEYYAENQGVFNAGSCSIGLKHAIPCKDGLILEPKDVEAVVVAELRYEYALNLLSRLGMAKARVGLDFIKN